MRIVTLDEIAPIVAEKSAVIEAVKDGFVAHGRGEITLPPTVQMMFNNVSDRIKGDCHIKTASASSYPYFCIKVASGFYQNPERGLPVNNGLVMLLSAETGQPLVLFQDDGYLTSLRTAAAGALSVGLRTCDKPVRLGIVGTGNQAELQARWIKSHNPVSEIAIWGRSQSKAGALADSLGDLGVNVETAASTPELCKRSDVIVTTTPSTAALISSPDIRSGHHIVAVGSDSPGKYELDPEILARADTIILDDYQQCHEHGEFGHAVRNGFVNKDKYCILGSYLESNSNPQIKADAISVVDLTGLGAQDLALASMVWQSELLHS